MFRRYFRLKARLLGYEGGLKFYDLCAPVGDAESALHAGGGARAAGRGHGAVQPAHGTS